MFALVTWLGFRQEYVEYDNQPRTSGHSGWTLAKKIALVVDSVASFSALPIRLCSYAGVALIVASFLVFPLSVAMLPALGAGSLFVLAVLFGLTGLQLLAIGVVGEYVWRALEEARQRSQYVVEAVAGRGEAAQAAVK